MGKEKEYEQQMINEGNKPGKKSFSYCWHIIEHSFDWEKVHAVMKHLDWEWVIDHKNNKKGIPSIDTIKMLAKDLLKGTWEKENNSSTGGFMCGYDNGDLWINFSIEECHTSNI